MDCILKGAKVYIDGLFQTTNIFVSNGVITNICSSIKEPLKSIVFDFSGFFIFPGLIDVHVHLREPGFSYKETIKTGTLAASHGGFTTICTMPNLNPTPDNFANLNEQLKIIKQDAIIEVVPYGTITKNQKGIELAEYREIKNYIVGISDDGNGIQNDEIMFKAMKESLKSDLIIAAHSEDKTYEVSDKRSEYGQVARDIKINEKIHSKHHVCHISTKESVDLIREAKQKNLDITCETAPHYLLLSENNIKDDGSYKMNPPLRSESDKFALIEGIIDGTIDMIATDHAPHSINEKNLGFDKSLNGIVGLETAFAVLYTNLVKTKIISLEKLIQLMHDNPKKRFKIGTDIKIGEKANLTVFDLNSKYTIDSNKFKSKGRSSPFNKMEVYGICKMTMYKGKIVWEERNEKN